MRSAAGTILLVIIYRTMPLTDVRSWAKVGWRMAITRRKPNLHCGKTFELCI